MSWVGCIFTLGFPVIYAYAVPSLESRICYSEPNPPLPLLIGSFFFSLLRWGSLLPWFMLTSWDQATLLPQLPSIFDNSGCVPLGLTSNLGCFLMCLFWMCLFYPRGVASIPWHLSEMSFSYSKAFKENREPKWLHRLGQWDSKARECAKSPPMNNSQLKNIWFLYFYQLEW